MMKHYGLDTTATLVKGKLDLNTTATLVKDKLNASQGTFFPPVRPQDKVSYPLSPRETWVAEQVRQAMLALRDCIEFSPYKMGGVPVLKGTRFPVAQIFAQLADGDTVAELAENFELESERISTLLHALAAYINRPVAR